VIDLHSHTLFSDGELLPAELIQRAEALGHQGIAITDHVDHSNLDHVLTRLLAVVAELNPHHRVQALAGVELTHLPPGLIAPAAARARELGAQVVVVHGETLVEPVPAGTNRAAIEAGVDILAHPGLLTAAEARLAAANGVHLEISSRKGHCLGNGLVAALAREHGALLVVNTDAHSPGDLIARPQAERVALGAGLAPEELEAVFANSRRILDRALGVAA
jgi:histidinol phosphatase-like PHP family hydrolase